HRPPHSFPTRRSSDLRKHCRLRTRKRSLSMLISPRADDRTAAARPRQILVHEARHLTRSPSGELPAPHKSATRLEFGGGFLGLEDRKSTRLNSSHRTI